MNKEKGEEADIEESKWEKSPGSGSIKSKPLEGSPKELKEKSQNDSDKEQMDLERRFREKDLERQRYRLDDGRKHRAHYEFDKFMRRNEEELKWGKGYSQDRGKKGNHNYSFTVEAVDKLGKGSPWLRENHPIEKCQIQENNLFKDQPQLGSFLNGNYMQKTIFLSSP
uniref:Uncharacterized protein n=1 Tax=Gopherus evgoodei TaxID=1825980 RepID=A0A8C4YGU4_9SAUR